MLSLIQAVQYDAQIIKYNCSGEFDFEEFFLNENFFMNENFFKIRFSETNNQSCQMKVISEIAGDSKWNTKAVDLFYYGLGVGISIPFNYKKDICIKIKYITDIFWRVNHYQFFLNN
jgi:hypothetical protein